MHTQEIRHTTIQIFKFWTLIERDDFGTSALLGKAGEPKQACLLLQGVDPWLELFNADRARLAQVPGGVQPGEGRDDPGHLRAEGPAARPRFACSRWSVCVSRTEGV